MLSRFSLMPFPISLNVQPSSQQQRKECNLIMFSWQRLRPFIQFERNTQCREMSKNCNNIILFFLSSYQFFYYKVELYGNVISNMFSPTLNPFIILPVDHSLLSWLENNYDERKNDFRWLKYDSECQFKCLCLLTIIMENFLHSKSCNIFDIKQ